MAGETIILPDGTTTVLPGSGDDPWDTELNNAVKALNTSTKNKIAAAVGALSLAPTYAGAGLVNSFDPRLSVYNWKAGNTRKLRAGLGRAAALTGFCHIVVPGDSLCTGYDGTGSTVDAYSWPRVMAAALADSFGTSLAGTGVVPATADNLGRLSDRWTVTGSANSYALPYIIANGGTGTATFTSQQTGTTAIVFWLDNGYGPITWTVDGGATQTITVGSTHTILASVATGLADTVHTITVNLPIYGAIAGASVGGQDHGVLLSNLSYGGSGVVAGGANLDWNDTSSYGGLGGCRDGMVADLGITVDMQFVDLGINDLASGASVSAIAAGLTTRRAKYPSADFALIAEWDIPGETYSSSFNALQAVKYALADSLDVPLIDWNDRLGGQATADANGALGPDHAHPAAGTGIVFGHAMAQLCAA